MGRRTIVIGLVFVVVAAVAVVLATRSTNAPSVSLAMPAWSAPHEVPNLNSFQAADISCSSVGNCAAVGGDEAVSETNGTWGAPAKVPLPTNATSADLTAVSCTPSGGCEIGGLFPLKYTLTGTLYEGSGAFVVPFDNGAFGQPTVLSPQATDGGETGNDVAALDCPTLASCAAGGVQFVDAQTNGVWGLPDVITAVPGEAGIPFVRSVSCSAPSSCTAVGTVMDGTATLGGFAVSLTSSGWGTPVAFTNTNGTEPSLTAVSCWAAGWCIALDSVTSPDPAAGASVPASADILTESDGVWGTAQAVPGVSVPTTDLGTLSFNLVNCPSATSCTAVGAYGPLDAPTAFVTVRRGGQWSSATTLTGLGVPSALACGPRRCLVISGVLGALTAGGRWGGPTPIAVASISSAACVGDWCAVSGVNFVATQSTP